MNHKKTKDAKEGADPRTLRNETNVEKYNFILPDGVDIAASDDYKF
jgi:hypothetical protein